MSIAAGETQATDRVMRAFENPFLHIWGHPTGRLLKRRDPSPLRMEALLDDLSIGRRVLFDDVGEGTIFPDGTESMSGLVVDAVEGARGVTHRSPA